MRAVLLAAFVCGLGLGSAFAQTTGFTVEPLDPVDPIDPADPVDPEQGQTGFESPPIDPDIGLFANPSDTQDSGFAPNDNPDIGFVETLPSNDVGMSQGRRPVASVTAVSAAVSEGAQLRSLDRTIGQTVDFDMETGETVVFGSLAIRLMECRYPVDNPASDAFAHLVIADLDGRSLFDGWMVASSPALMALEHPRYDVWVLNCSTS